jgi:hypothetical protein
MVDFKDFSDSTRVNNMAIQRVLRQIDTGELAVALLGLSDEDRSIFLRNMSVRAVELLKNEIADLEAHPKETFKESSGKTQKKLLSMLGKHLEMTRDDEERTPDKVPAINWKSEEELIETFAQLVRFVRRHGALSIESVISDDLPPLLKKGLELYVDGWDPSLIQSILEQLKETLITRYINKQNMILEGIGTLTGFDFPIVAEEKLRAFRLSDQ